MSYKDVLVVQAVIEGALRTKNPNGQKEMKEKRSPAGTPREEQVHAEGRECEFFNSTNKNSQ
jgi:hypothetical protein